MFVLLFLSAAAVDVGLKQGKTVIVVKVIYFILFFFILIDSLRLSPSICLTRNKSDSI